MADDKNVKRDLEFSTYRKSEDKSGFNRSDAMREAYENIIKSMKQDSGGNDAGNKNDD